MKGELKEIKEKLKQLEERIVNLESIIISSDYEEHMILGTEEGIKKLSQKTNAPEEKIKELFDFEDEKLILIKIIGEGTKESTQKMTLTLILGYKYLFGIEKVLSKEIKRNIALNEISINNFAAYLNEMVPSLIRRIAKSPNDPNTLYKLTFPGEKRALNIIKEYAGV